MESFVILVQYQPFQFYSLFWSDGKKEYNKIQEKNKSQQNRDQWWILLQGRRRTYRPRTSVSPVKRSYEIKIFGVPLLRKRSDRWDLISAQTKSKLPTTEWKTDIETYKRSGRPDKISWKMAWSRGNSSRRNRAIRLERGNSSWQIGATWYRFSRRGKTSTTRHWKRWSRIGIVSRIKIIRESGEWSGAKKTEKNFKCYRKWRKTFYDLGNVHGCSNGLSSIHGKEIPDQLSLHCEYDRSHTQTNVRHIYEIGVWAGWDLRIGNYLSLIGDERIFSLQRTKVYVFSDSVLCLGKILENPESNEAWEQRSGWIKSSQTYRNFDGIRWEPTEFECNISQDSIRCSSVTKSKVYCTDSEKHQKFHRKNFIYVDVQRLFLFLAEIMLCYHWWCWFSHSWTRRLRMSQMKSWSWRSTLDNFWHPRPSPERRMWNYETPPQLRQVR